MNFTEPEMTLFNLWQKRCIEIPRKYFVLVHNSCLKAEIHFLCKVGFLDDMNKLRFDRTW